MPNTVDSLTVPEMPISDEVYTNENDIPKNGVGYNVAVLLNNYPESASPPIVLPNGVESTLTVSNATAVTDQVTISDTNAATISIDISKWMKFIPTSASYTKSLGVTYANGTVKTFTETNSIKIKPKTALLTATPYYYKTQMSGDRWVYEDGKLRKVNIQPNSFTADIVYAEGWEIRKPDGSLAKPGEDY